MAEPLRAVVDGAPVAPERAALAVTDDGAARGDGAFETVGVWDGVPYRLGEHLDRLQASLARLLLPGVDRAALESDVAAVLDGHAGDGVLRCYATGSGARAVTLSPLPDRPPPRRLASVPAPWVAAVPGFSAAKSMSFGPYAAAARLAGRAGADEALLVADDGTVLEGATCCVLWVVGGELRAPPLARGLLDSISRRALCALAADLGVGVGEAEATVDDVAAADEVLLCSAGLPATAVTEVDGRRLPAAAPVTERLATALEAERRRTRAAPIR